MQGAAQNTIRVFDTLVYFDGYAGLITNPPAPAGVTRLRNDLYTRKLTGAEIQSVGSTLDMKVTIGALCDNYDRIGMVALALVPKGAASYDPDNVQRLEIGRFITPFMNKNYQPVSVPYNFNIDNVAALLKETSITAVYDVWIELQVFGVPYAANNEVAGCSGRNDVFHGSLEFTTNSPAPAQSNNVLIPVAFNKDFNNYNATATDTLGKTTRTYQITVPQTLTDATLFLITSNHGANTNGEEYVRRNHYVYFDNELKLTYKPGRTSCEPFRQYNTQGNGIYGPSPRSDAQWQSFSNWCPGDVITTRIINVGSLTQGTHTFRINVPDAVFAAQQGNFPLSLYVHGKTSGGVSIDNVEPVSRSFSIYPNPSSDHITIENLRHVPVKRTEILDMVGRVVYHSDESDYQYKTISLDQLAPGLYIVRFFTEQGTGMQKIQVIR